MRHQTHAPQSRTCRLMMAACLMLAATLPAMGCQREIKVSDKDLTQIQYKDLVTLMEEGKEGQVVLLDPRRPSHYADGHLPGAINIFLPDIQPGDARLGKARHIIVYGGGWSDPISSAAGKRLMALGYKGVVDFRGGIDAWRAEGRLLAVQRDDATSPAPSR